MARRRGQQEMHMSEEELAAARDLSKKLREQDRMQVALDERTAQR